VDPERVCTTLELLHALTLYQSLHAVAKAQLSRMEQFTDKHTACSFKCKLKTHRFTLRCTD